MTTPSTDQQWIERVEASRDLKSQLGSLGQDETQEISFTEWSPGRKLVTIWSMETGEEATLPRYQAAAAVNSYMWTADKGKAPTPRVNSVKCFLHKEAAERPVLDELGITRTCNSAQLANAGSKRDHAEHRHRTEWRQYQEYLAEANRAKAESRGEEQTAAMLELVRQGRANGDAPPKRQISEQAREKMRANLAKARAAKKKGA